MKGTTKKNITTPASSQLRSNLGGKSAAPSGKTKQDYMQDVSPNNGGSILERVKAFVNLKFTPTIEEMAYIKEEEDIKKVENVQL